MDITMQGILGVIAVIVLFKLAFYTVKKVIIHVITGYAAYYIATAYFGIPIDLGIMMWALMALFGPLPIVAVGLWKYFGA